MLQQLRDMEVHDELEFPIERAASVKACCSAFGLQWNKKFKTEVKRKERILKVTRES